MKILIVSDAWRPQVNGVVRTYEYLRDELVAMGHDVKVIGPADFPFRVPLPGYPEIKLALFPHFRLRRMINSYAPDMLHIATEGPLGFAARSYACKHNMDFTTAYHTHFPDYLARRVRQYMPFLESRVKRQAIKTVRNFHAPAAAMMVATQSLEDDLNAWGFKTPKTRMTRGVNPDVFRPGPKTLFRDLPGPVALYVGRVAIEKSLHKFLDMPWDGSKIVVGHGPSMDYFIKRYPDARFTGKKIGQDLVEHYRSADVFVFPSRTDTFGIVLIEALACGLPVAAYNVTGPKDIITDKTLGILHDDLETAAQDALKHGSADERFKHVRDHYSWKKAAEQFLSAKRNMTCGRN